MRFLRASVCAALGTGMLAGCSDRQVLTSPEAKDGQAVHGGRISDDATAVGRTDATAVPLTSGVSTPLPNRADANPEFLRIGFDKLSGFPLKVIYQLTNPVTFASVPKLNAPIPEAVKALDGKAIAVTGFMLPLKLEEGRTREFLLMKNRSLCCFGIPLEINDWVCVRMTNQPVRSVMDQPMTVYGTFHVGEILENGQIAGIYRLEGKKLEGPGSF